ncbi:hypothetical protein SlGVgp073 [Spodoptera litura granulovirus]|uniref:P45 n=1 Tax=Spodoptera litura granulovirus TaxID=359919 RepID=A5IZS5_9BBAC|nr:hypothetical protein SlGVgp073 [Spodoptera litura granulovirus]ABQ52016.1 hypothetical protein SlGVgp073 [Spodoptera litura granulovirus]
MMKYEVEYTFRFFKMDQSLNVKFLAKLEESEIDTLAFLLSEYFNQQHMFVFKGLTFFSQYKHVIEVIKNDYEAKANNDPEVKKVFKMFVENDFIGQVPSFQLIINVMRPYYKPLPSVDVDLITCDICPKNKFLCIACKASYVSLAVTLLDSSLQDGWDNYFRPMLGIPLLFFIIFRSDLTQLDDELFSVDNIITNSLLIFFYNLLCDKTTPMYWDHKKCKPLISNCKKYVQGIKDDSLERLLAGLNTSTYNTKLYAPLKQFMEQHFKNNKQVGKIIHKIFLGFFLRIYLEAADGKTRNAYDLETRNVCNIIFKDYKRVDFEEFMNKLAGIKQDLCLIVVQNLIIPKECIVTLFNKYNLENDISNLIQKTVSFA